MTDQHTQATTTAPAPDTARWRYIGPGLVMAATGVGAGDMVSSIAAGGEYGLILAWAIFLGAFLKYVINEGLGRWYLVTGTTPMRGIVSLGTWSAWYVTAYLVVLAFVFGAAVMSACGLALNAMFPVGSVNLWAAVSGVVGLGILWIGRYGTFEKIMGLLVALMFVTVVGSAALTTPSLPALAKGMTFQIPDGSLLYVLGLVGGVGATITLASYGYWLRDKGWSGPAWLPVMRLDLIVGYVLTPVFMVSMLIVGAQFLHGAAQGLDSEEGLIALSEPFGERFGDTARWLFLGGFFCAAFTSVLGAFNAMAYLFADLVRMFRGVPDEQATEHTTQKVLPFRAFLLWCTFPPMLLFLLGEPVMLVIVYAALGALIMPFLAVALLVMFNSKRVPRESRNGVLPNGMLLLCLALFAVLAYTEVVDLF
ncbi:MAG: Nramp family divalent metal transporter [Actinomycetes bacterium]